MRFRNKRLALVCAVFIGSALTVWSALHILSLLPLSGFTDLSDHSEGVVAKTEIPDELWAPTFTLSDAYHDVLLLSPWKAGSKSRARAIELNLRISSATHCLYQAFSEYRLRGGDTSLTPGIISGQLEAAVFSGIEARKHYDAFNRAVSGSVWTLPDDGDVVCR